MPCCTHCKNADAHFGLTVAQRDVERYRKHGPGPTTRLLLAGIEAVDLRDAALLDIGGGIGVLHHELLGKTVATATLVEAANAYITIAREEDERRGHVDQVQYLHGDAVELSSELPVSDIVTLDRVICCYPDWDGLVRTTADRSQRYYAFSMPRDRWYVRLAMGIENLARRLMGDPFRAFVHPTASVDVLLRELGFTPTFQGRTLAWHVALYQRSGAS